MNGTKRTPGEPGRKLLLTLAFCVSLALVSASSGQVLEGIFDPAAAPQAPAGEVAPGIGPAPEGALQKRIGGVRIPFVSNRGQTDQAVAYYASTFAGRVFVTKKGEIVFSLPARTTNGENPSRPGARVSSKAVGAGWTLTETPVGGQTHITAEKPAVTQVSYFIGNDPRRWRSGIATHETVGLGEVWPGMRVWQGLKQGLSLRDISRRLQEEFQIDLQRSNDSVLWIVRELSQEELVWPAD